MTTETRVLSGRYRVDDLIGRGGMASVYRGYDQTLGRTVAIKILKADLAGHEDTVRALREELVEVRAETENVAAAKDELIEGRDRLIAEKDEALGAVTADLAGHRAALEELQGLRERELEELERRGEALEEVNQQLSAQNEIVRRAHLQLAGDE